MPAYTKKQKRAAQVAYGMKKRGKTPRAFRKASMEDLHKFASEPVRKKRKSKV